MSAEASFGAAAVLMPVGLSCVREAVRKEPAKLALAAIPLIFGVQQACEGFVWLELNRGASRPDSPAALAYLFFAFWLWPAWIPFSVALFERRGRPFVLLLLLLGIGVGAGLWLPLIFEPERLLVIEVIRHSIHYQLGDLPIFRVVPEMVLRGIYLAIIILPFAFSDRRLQGFGAAVLASSLVSQIAFGYAFFSIWCLFAALLSLYLGVYFARLPRRTVRPEVGPTAG
ncbi:DUF6629 family protein [Tautonia marina]|uniref:DUF6629 family protein n=1 Tax=Tautonia marina TaxID=2653855 RepID=UPI00126119D7|nr:DUF6629 family protein [Tautonia marina]